MSQGPSVYKMRGTDTKTFDTETISTLTGISSTGNATVWKKIVKSSKLVSG